MPGSNTALPNFENLFHATEIDLLIPTWSSVPTSSSSSSSSTRSTYDTAESANDAPGWWKGVKAAPLRQVSFLDEKLFYVVSLSVPDDALSSSSGSSPPGESGEPPSDLLRFLSRLQLTMTTTLLPPLSSRPNSLTALPPPSGANLFVPQQPHTPRTPDMSTSSSGPPVTPNPFPRMEANEEQYAGVEGVLVWEGPVEMDVKGEGGSQGSGSHGGEDDTSGRASRVIVRGEKGWDVVYKGQVPVAYVRTQIQNPVLGLTASVTLRDAPVRVKKAGNAETSSIYSAADTVRTDGTEDVDGVEEDEEEFAGMEEIDLLGGLGAEHMPSSRLASSIREDLSLPLVTPTSARTSVTPFSAPQPPTASSVSTAGPSRERHAPTLNLLHSNHTLRKSYRRVLSLSSGLRIRMRTLFLPQLLPPRPASHDPHQDEDEGERRVALCVEVENPHENGALPFEVEDISVDVGGKGGKVSAELLCQPETYRGEQVFPLTLDPVEQYNLLYGVSITTTAEDRGTEGDENLARAMGKGDEQRPVAITVNGRPYSTLGGVKAYPTDKFSSRWNCTLDLAPFYAAGSALDAKPRAAMKPTTAAVPNAIVGDKRFSIASLANARPNRPLSQRMPTGLSGSGVQRPVNLPGSRVNSMRGPVVSGHGLLVSVKVLPGEGDTGGVQALEPFSMEVFVQNRTDEVRRFRLGIPPREEYRGVREVWAKRRRRREDEPEWGVDDNLLRQMLASNLSSSPALIPLEDDVRCGPLLPGASMSARLRFLALREGVHSIERLRITGSAEEFDFLISPVLDVVVGAGAE